MTMTLDGPGQSRRSDPWTSQAAAGMVRPGSARRSLLEAHASRPDGLTDEEAASIGGVSLESEYATRCSELARAGLLETLEMARAGRSGTARVVRRITPLGVQVLQEDHPPVVSPVRASPQEEQNIVRVEREGRPDQYLNLRKARADSVQNARLQAAKDEEDRKRNTPRVDPRSHRLTLGGPLPCRRCGGTAGNLLEACFGCGGTGLTG